MARARDAAARAAAGAVARAARRVEAGLRAAMPDARIGRDGARVTATARDAVARAGWIAGGFR